MMLPRGLVVSCQARADNPLHGPQFMGAMALAARDGGAVAIRANGPADIAAVKASGLPVIGIHKVFSDAFPVYITPDFAAAEAIVAAGAAIVALDCTERPRDFRYRHRLVALKQRHDVVLLAATRKAAQPHEITASPLLLRSRHELHRELVEVEIAGLGRQRQEFVSA